MAFVALAAASLFAAAPAARARPPQQAGTGRIVGRILFQGPSPQLHAIDMAKDPVCVSEHSSPALPQDGRVNPNGTLPNAFVYVLRSSATLPSAPPRVPVVLTQKGCEYEPHVLGLMVGQNLEVLTLDPTTHNIHVLPKLNPEWNVSQQPGSPSIVRKFTRPEVMIAVRCNVHPWMSAYIGVVDDPFFAVTGADGSFTLNNLPPGDYTIVVWTATFGSQQQNLTVRAGETATADFTFTPH
jgi:plastocyanin